MFDLHNYSLFRWYFDEDGNRIPPMYQKTPNKSETRNPITFKWSYWSNLGIEKTLNKSSFKAPLEEKLWLELCYSSFMYPLWNWLLLSLIFNAVHYWRCFWTLWDPSFTLVSSSSFLPILFQQILGLTDMFADEKGAQNMDSGNRKYILKRFEKVLLWSSA